MARERVIPQYSISTTLSRDKLRFSFNLLRATVNDADHEPGYICESVHTSSRVVSLNNGIAAVEEESDSSKRTAGYDEEQQCCTIEAPRKACLAALIYKPRPNMGTTGYIGNYPS